MRLIFTHDDRNTMQTHTLTGHRNTKRTHTLTRHRNLVNALAALALIACLATAGCGGSSAGSVQDKASTSGSAQGVATTGPVHNDVTASGPVHDKASTPSSPQATGSHASTVSHCAAKAGSDPASMSICLAAHGLTVRANGELLHCLQSAADASGVTACLTKWAR